MFITFLANGPQSKAFRGPMGNGTDRGEAAMGTNANQPRLRIVATDPAQSAMRRARASSATPAPRTWRTEPKDPPHGAASHSRAGRRPKPSRICRGAKAARRCDPALPEIRPERADHGDGLNLSRIDPAGPR
jgi:hypothetical protein